MAITPGPWKACRAHEGFDGPFFDIDPGEQAEYDARPITSIHAASGPVASAHDLFEFNPDDARAIAALPELLDLLRRYTEMDRQTGTTHNNLYWSATRLLESLSKQ